MAYFEWLFVWWENENELSVLLSCGEQSGEGGPWYGAILWVITKALCHHVSRSAIE